MSLLSMQTLAESILKEASNLEKSQLIKSLSNKVCFGFFFDKLFRLLKRFHQKIIKKISNYQSNYFQIQNYFPISTDVHLTKTEFKERRLFVHNNGTCFSTDH